ncbi:MAG: 2-hydroxyglutaryl-CoA dehydratase [Planctomycetes bacterium]|nr:2-hydroxyglutaryl-CoA dehydratase [Planctomycetota bacterium]MCP4771520.1 2-hydroxyglutaryl-CoA dehydratase [Planctomycetota bacterium]MCP4861181.1 2-hydroxyglutaryl-CoA dehydratase [Planctomycetota bacterium]
MSITAGIDVGSTYTKAILLNGEGQIVARHVQQTGFKLAEVAERCFNEIMEKAGVQRSDVEYVIATGFGRHQVSFKDLHVTDLTASARGAHMLFPGTRSILDVGGQTMKAIRLEDTKGMVKSFRLNDKCAAGTGAFLEKTARYMGYETEDIGPLLSTSRSPVEISGVCAVFAESEVINQLSLGTPPADIMQGAIESLTGRAVQLMKRAKAESEFTLIGGIMRFNTMPAAVRERVEAVVNLPGEEDNDLAIAQFVTALGAAVLGQRRLEKLAQEAGAV